MPKRHLSVQNKGTDQEQQSSSVSARSSAKRTHTDEPVSAKKPKLEEKIVDKENAPKGQATRRKNKAKAPAPLPSPPPPPSPPVQIIEPVASKNVDTTDMSDTSDTDNITDTTDDDDDDDGFFFGYDDDDDDEEEEEEELPIPAATNNDQCMDHPSNKQYVIYPNGGPNGQPFVVSKTARFWNRKYCKVLRNVYPDAFGMYIHADFSCYGELEVVENCLLDLTKAIFMTQRRVPPPPTYVRKEAGRVNYVLAFRRAEALTMVLDHADGIGGIDDGDRFYDIMRVIGACYVTILRGLFPKAMFKPIDKIDRNLVKKLASLSRQIPNLKFVLERILTVGHILVTIGDVCSAYTHIVQIVYRNWLFIMENLTIDLNTKPATMNDEVWKALKHAFTIDPKNLASGEPESFEFLSELADYKAQHGLGGETHDLSKWSRRERAAYALGRSNPFSDFWF